MKKGIIVLVVLFSSLFIIWGLVGIKFTLKKDCLDCTGDRKPGIKERPLAGRYNDGDTENNTGNNFDNKSIQQNFTNNSSINSTVNQSLQKNNLSVEGQVCVVGECDANSSLYCNASGVWSSLDYCDNCEDEDCVPVSFCGDGVCGSEETESNCFADCGEVVVSVNRFGTINFGINDLTYLDDSVFKMNEIGINFVRVNVYWEDDFDIDGDGVYDFSYLDNALNKLTGQEVLVMIVTRNLNNYDSTICGANPSPPAGCPPYDYQDYYNFIYEFTQHFKNKVDIIQIDNEVGAPKYWKGTIDDYIKVLNTAYDAIKAADQGMPVAFAGFPSFEMTNYPECVVLNNGVQSPTATAELDKALAESKYDIIDLHQYKTYQEIENKVRCFNDKVKSGVKYISTESSGPQDYGCLSLNVPPNHCTDINYADQSAHLVKRFSIMFSEGFERVNWFSFVDLEGEDCPFKCMGLVHYDPPVFAKKPVFYTYGLFIEKVGGFSSIEKISDGMYKYVVKGKPVIVVWSETGDRNVDLSSYFSGSNVKITHIITVQGETEPLTEAKNTNFVFITEEPIFVEEY